MNMAEGKRLLVTCVTILVSAAIVALNKKIGLGLDDATVATLAAAIAGIAAIYIWGQTRTDQTEANKEKKDE